MPERQWVFAASVTMGRTRTRRKSANCSSTPTRSPIPGGTDGGADDLLLRLRRVGLTRIAAELVEQTPRSSERAPELADVLAQHEDALVCPHGVDERALRSDPSR